MKLVCRKSLGDQFVSPLQHVVMFIVVPPFLLIFSNSYSNASASSITTARQEAAGALLTWKANLNTSQSLLVSWSGISSPYDSWIGIGCKGAGSVTHITVPSYDLKGTLHELNFSSFPNLFVLNLYNNSLYGTIPSNIGSLSKLTLLDLSINLKFSGYLRY